MYWWSTCFFSENVYWWSICFFSENASIVYKWFCFSDLVTYKFSKFMGYTKMSISSRANSGTIWRNCYYCHLKWYPYWPCSSNEADMLPGKSLLLPPKSLCSCNLKLTILFFPVTKGDEIVKFILFLPTHWSRIVNTL